MVSTLATLRRSAFLALFGMAALIVSAACSKVSSQSPAADARTPKLPVPLLDVMRAAVEISADGIWAAQASDKLTDPDWLLADQDSAALAAAATLISMGGAGTNDAAWVANADWQAWAADIQKTALQAREAARAKDAGKLSDTADHLLETCQACHAKYRPEVPSDGVVRYPFYPARAVQR